MKINQDSVSLNVPNNYRYKIFLILIGIIQFQSGFCQVINSNEIKGTIACVCVTDTTDKLFVDYKVSITNPMNDKIYHKVSFVFDSLYKQTLLIRKEREQLLATTENYINDFEKDQILVDFSEKRGKSWKISRLPLFQFGKLSIDSIFMTPLEKISFVNVSQYLKVSDHIKINYIMIGDKSGIIAFRFIDNRRFGEQYKCVF